jgi:hypothetical protein
MLKFKFGVKIGKLAQLKLSAAEYRAIGDAAVDRMKMRILQGVNADNQRAKPLSKKYAALKAEMRHTRRPIRDMFLSGMTLTDYRVQRAYGGVIEAYPSSTEAQKRAILAQHIDPMFGFTDAEEKEVVKQVRLMYGRNAKTIWKNA